MILDGLSEMNSKGCDGSRVLQEHGQNHLEILPHIDTQLSSHTHQTFSPLISQAGFQLTLLK